MAVHILFQFQKHGTTQKPSKPITLDVEDQQKMAKVGLEMKLLTSEVDAEAEKWDEYAENDIVKRAKVAFYRYSYTAKSHSNSAGCGKEPQLLIFSSFSRQCRRWPTICTYSRVETVL